MPRKKVNKVIPEGILLGTAELRVTGKSGDTRLSYPLINDIESLHYLDDEGQAAVREAMRLVSEAQSIGNTVFTAKEITEKGGTVGLKRLNKGEFDTTAPHTIIVPRTVGGSR